MSGGSGMSGETVRPAMRQPGQGTTGDEPDPHRGARLLLTERAGLLPLLQQEPPAAFGNPTACPGWSVRDVLAHCSSALTRAIDGTLHAFTPELNEADVAARRGWPLADVLAELDRGCQEAGPVISAAAGKLDGLALGVWVHGGDVRDALGAPGAYASDGFCDACVLLAARTRARKAPLVQVSLPSGSLTLGVEHPGRQPASLRTGKATLIRLCAGRPSDPAACELSGAQPGELMIF